MVEMEGGVNIEVINDKLFDWNLGLMNMGGYDQQLIMGVIATSTHGSGISLAPFCDMVKSLVIATTGALDTNDDANAVNFYRIEPSNGITNRNAYDAQGSRIKLIQNDDIFNSVACSMGCFGIVYSVVLEVCESYYLQQTRLEKSLTEVMELLQPVPPTQDNPDGVCDLLRNNRHVEIYINPYPMKSGLFNIPEIYDFDPGQVEQQYPNVRVLVTIRNYSSNRTVQNAPTGFTAWLQTIQAFYYAMAVLLNSFKSLSPAAIVTSMNTLYATSGYNDKSFHIFNLGTPGKAGYACEFGYPIIKPGTKYYVDNIVSLNNSLIINALNMRKNKDIDVYHTSPYSLRFVKQSNSYLSMMHNQATLMCEIDTLINTGITKGKYVIMDIVENMVKTTNDIRFHWGLDFDIANDISVYENHQIWKNNYKVFNKKKTFSSQFTERFKLDIEE